jgi:hypothetical protein
MTNKWQWLEIGWMVIVWTLCIVLAIRGAISGEWGSLITLSLVVLFFAGRYFLARKSRPPAEKPKTNSN